MTVHQMIKVLEELDRNQDIVIFTSSGVLLSVDGIYEVNRQNKEGGKSYVGISCKWRPENPNSNEITLNSSPVYIAQKKQLL